MHDRIDRDKRKRQARWASHRLEHPDKRVDLRLVYSGCLTPISLPQRPQSRCAFLSRQIRRAHRRILPDLEMRALIDRFERTLDDDASARRSLLPLPASGTLAFAFARLLLLRWGTEYIYLLLMELTRRAAELPRDITADRPVNKRILGISAEASDKYVRLTFEGSRRGRLLLLLVLLFGSLPLPERTEGARLEDEGKVGGSEDCASSCSTMWMRRKPK
jgi:hypothetical protein